MTAPGDEPRRPGAGANAERPGDRAADGGWRGSRGQMEARIEREVRRRQTFERRFARRGGWNRRWGPGGGPAAWGAGPGDWPPGEARPDWWPAGEPCPPRPRRPWRGFGCLFGLVFFVGVLGVLALGTSLVGRVLEAPGPFGGLVRLASILLIIAVLAGIARAAGAVRGSGSTLDALVDQAARVEAGDYTARVAVGRPMPGPVEQLARGFNTMAARLEADEAQRRRLLADVTHELRTPLAVIRGSVEAIVDGIHPPDETHLGAILEETRVLDRLIEDLRTLALSESGGLSLHREPTDLAVLVADVATSFGAAAQTAGITVATDVAEDMPLLDVDPVRIREVIGNLVANAVRHTPAGGTVTVGASHSAATAEVVVHDTGPGIARELLPQVFERFARGAGSTGSGLGLAIARGLVELHGGTIAAESPSGDGATIRIRLPIGNEPG